MITMILQIRVPYFQMRIFLLYECSITPNGHKQLQIKHIKAILSHVVQYNRSMENSGFPWSVIPVTVKS